MIKIAIVGAGQLGSRHLQALSKLKFDCEIFIVDPSDEALTSAQSRFQETYTKDYNIKLHKLKTAAELPKDIFISVVATNADCRREILDYLFHNTECEYYLIEKVLFQRIEDYHHIKTLFSNSDKKAWVNCPRRMWKFYKNLKVEMGNDQLLHLSVVGSNWGFASNSIHFFDLGSFLTGINSYQVNSLFLSSEAIETKRKGFYDFFGNLSGSYENGTSISITSLKGEQIPFILNLHFTNTVYVIRDWEGIYYKSEFKKEFEKNKFEVEFQSSLTNLLVDEIIKSNSCSLTPLNDSIDLHLAFIKELENQLKSRDQKIDRCLIT
jgi:hypothetical protein